MTTNRKLFNSDEKLAGPDLYCRLLQYIRSIIDHHAP